VHTSLRTSTSYRSPCLSKHLLYNKYVSVGVIICFPFSAALVVDFSLSGTSVGCVTVFGMSKLPSPAGNHRLFRRYITARGLGVVDYSLRDLFVKALKCTTHLSALNILFGRMMSCFTGSPFKRLRSRLVLSNRGRLLKSGRTYRFIAPATCSHRSFPVLFNLRAYRARPTNLECLVDRSPQPQCRLNLYISRVGAGLRFV